MKIIITTNHTRSSYGIPVCLIDGEVVDDWDGFAACCTALGWTRQDAADATGKALGSIDNYRNGRLPVPAEVWNVIRDSL